jgi:hypothetical protein
MRRRAYVLLFAIAHGSACARDDAIRAEGAMFEYSDDLPREYSLGPGSLPGVATIPTDVARGPVAWYCYPPDTKATVPVETGGMTLR